MISKCQDNQYQREFFSTIVLAAQYYRDIILLINITSVIIFPVCVLLKQKQLIMLICSTLPSYSSGLLGALKYSFAVSLVFWRFGGGDGSGIVGCKIQFTLLLTTL